MNRPCPGKDGEFPLSSVRGPNLHLSVCNNITRTSLITIHFAYWDPLKINWRILYINILWLSHLQKLNRLTGLVRAHRGNVVFQNTPESNNWALKSEQGTKLSLKHCHNKTLVFKNMFELILFAFPVRTTWSSVCICVLFDFCFVFVFYIYICI